MRELLRISNLVSYLVGIAGILLSIYFYEVSQPELAISYRKSSVQLYKRLGDEFTVYQNGELRDIKSIVRTRIVFWNSGNTPVKIDELRSRPQISFSHETHLLDYLVPLKSPDLAGFSVTRDGDNLLLGWKFFDPSFVLVVDVFHTGRSEDVVPVISFVKGKSILEEVRDFNKLWVAFTLLFGGSIAVTFLFFFMLNKLDKRLPSSSVFKRTFMGFLAFFLFLLLVSSGLVATGGYLFWKLTARSVPEQVARYIEEDAHDNIVLEISEAALDGSDMKRLVADFDRDWPEVTRTREIFVLAEEFSAA